MSVSFGGPFDSSLFSALAFPQAQLFASASQIPAFALPTILNGFDSISGSPFGNNNPFIPPFLSMQSPSAAMPFMQPIAGGGYAQNVDLAPYSQNNFLSRMFDPDRREAGRMERVLRNDPFARSAFEQAVGGRIVDFGGANDGKFTIERAAPNPYAQALGGGALGPLASQLGSIYQQMNQGVPGGGIGPGGLGGNPLQNLLLNGFTGIASQLMNGGPFNPNAALLGGQQPFASYNGGIQGMPPLFGQGQASWNPLAQPGKIQGGNAQAEGAHSAQVHSVLSDPSLTMEDKIMLALMLICSKMDVDIKRQTEYLNQLQNQQGARKGGGKGGKAGGGEKSIDLETKKLERMITKRSQLFDTLGKIMERYDQSAKNVIQSMRG